MGALSADFSSQHLAVLGTSSPSPWRTILENFPFKIVLEPFCYALPCTLTSLITSFIHSTHIYWVPLACEAGVPALGSVPVEGSLGLKTPSFPQRFGIPPWVNLAFDECQQRISDFEESLRIVSSNLLPPKTGGSGRLELKVTWQGVVAVGWGLVLLALPYTPCPQDCPAFSAPPSAPLHCVLSI